MILGSSLALADAKSECEKALADAKRAGLPTSRADLNLPKPTKDSAKIEEILARADKAMRQNQESLGSSIKQDLTNVQRKQKGKAEIPYPAESNTQKAKREAQVLRILDGLAKTTGPRVVSKVNPPDSSFVYGANARSFVRLELTAAEALAKAGKSAEALASYRIARRLVELTNTDETMVSVLMQNATAQIYYASLEKSGKDNPGFKKAISRQLIASFARPSNQRILQAEYLHSLDLFMKKGWKLPTDPQSLDFVTKSTRSWIVAFSAMKATKTGLEMETAYKSIQSKMGSYKMKGDDEEIPYGPSWASSARALDKSEAKRLEVVKSLGM